MTASSLEAAFSTALQTRSDIVDHLPMLHKLATLVDSVTEFGVRGGVSTLAFLRAKPRRWTGYDVVRSEAVDRLEQFARDAGVQFAFHQMDILALERIESTDLLMIDSLHTRDQVAHELSFAPAVTKYIVLHDTETFGMTGERGKPGIWSAVSEFLRRHAEWSLQWHDARCHGLTVLERR